MPIIFTESTGEGNNSATISREGSVIKIECLHEFSSDEDIDYCENEFLATSFRSAIEEMKKSTAGVGIISKEGRIELRRGTNRGFIVNFGGPGWGSSAFIPPEIADKICNLS